MSEEVKVRMSIPMFEVGELETFDNNIHSIVEEYSKLMFKEKDQILTQRIIMKQEEEIERLEKRNKEIYEGFMATTEELCEATKEIERLNNIIKEIKDYFEDLEIFAPSRDIKYDILDIIEGSGKE